MICLLAFAAMASTPEPPKLAWELNLGAESDSSPAVGPDGRLYFGMFNGQFWCVNSRGEREWRFSTGMEIWSSPAVDTNGVIYFGCRDRHLYALTPSGRRKWRFKTGGWVDASPAIGTDGTIYFGSWDTNFYAVSPEGKELWRRPTGGPIVSSAAIARDGTIFFGSHDGLLRALTPLGEEFWSFRTGGPILSSPALDEAGRVYFTSVDGFFYVVDVEGRLVWKTRTGSAGVGSPVLDGAGRIFVGLNTNLWALSPGGERLWSAGGQEIRATPLLTADGVVLMPFYQGQMQGCPPDRAWSWAAGIPYDAAASPTLANGHLYVLAGRMLRAYEWPAGLANTPWPKFRGNARNTGNLADRPREALPTKGAK
ncbi:MAG: PQQ-binding-like beta-propeller repeat protein [Limisphaerales bacterium]